MVKKLFKHEFVYYLRSLLIYLPVVLVIGGLSRLMVCFESESGIYSLLLGSTLLMLYFGTLACVIITFILSIVRFYKNMFSAEGYLTLTLPVSKTTHLFVKLTTAVLDDEYLNSGSLVNLPIKNALFIIISSFFLIFFFNN